MTRWAAQPGVHSARFLRPDAPYPERFDEIYRRLAGGPTRPVRTVRLCARGRAGNAVVFETTGLSRARSPPRRAVRPGFGYDPIFLFPPYQRTLAEVTRDEKLAVAHRGKAFRALGGLAARPFDRHGNAVEAAAANIRQERETENECRSPFRHQSAAGDARSPGIIGRTGGPSARLIRWDLRRPAWQVSGSAGS